MCIKNSILPFKIKFIQALFISEFTNEQKIACKDLTFFLGSSSFQPIFFFLEVLCQECSTSSFTTIINIKDKSIPASCMQKSQTESTDSYSLRFFDMCQSVHHLFVIPISFQQIPHKSYDQVSYVLLTYTSQDTTIQDLALEFKNIMPEFSKWEGFRFTLSKGYLIPNYWTIRDLKRELRRKNIEGIFLYVFDNASRLSASEKFENQTCLEDYLRLQRQYNSKPPPLQIKIVLPGEEKNTITLNAYESDSTKKLIADFLKQIQRQFDVLVILQDIERFVIKRTQQTLLEDVKIEKADLIYGDQIIAEFVNKDKKFVREIKTYNKRFIIYDFNNKQEERYVRLWYNLIKYQTLGSVYEKYFKEKMDKLYLKVLDLVIQQDQTFQKIEQYFKEPVENDQIIIVGYIIDEKTLFYSRIKDDTQDSYIEYSQIEPNEQMRNMIERQISIRASQLKNDKYIRDKSHLQPIYLYTSETKLNGLTIYEGVNNYLRQTTVSQISSRSAREEWRFRFVKTLIRMMEKIQNTKFKHVYRGDSYIPDKKEGEIIKFPSFLSTSTQMSIAYKFPIQRNNALKIISNKFSLFIMNIKKGKSIAKYSAKRSQSQILLEPYSQFLVKTINQQNFKYLNEDYKFTVFELQQVNFQDCQIPESKANFILWIDDKLSEGQKLFRNISEIPQPLIFKQFLSTEGFRNWLEINQNLLKDLTANIIVISNMRRLENRIQNPTAGLESLGVLRSYRSSIPVIFYVGNKQATNTHLANSNLKQNVVVCNKEQQLMKYIKKYTSVGFPIKEQKGKNSSCMIQ